MKSIDFQQKPIARRPSSDSTVPPRPNTPPNTTPLLNSTPPPNKHVSMSLCILALVVRCYRCSMEFKERRTLTKLCPVALCLMIMQYG